MHSVSIAGSTNYLSFCIYLYVSFINKSNEQIRQNTSIRLFPYNAIFFYEVDTSSVTGSVHITLL